MKTAAAKSNHDKQLGQAQLLMTLFDHWSLSQMEIANLLGISTSSRDTLSKYRKGERGISTAQDSQQRAGYLLGIHKALRLLYPRNKELLYGWIKKRNKYFDNLTPLEIMKEEGLIGIARVYQCVNFMRGQ